MLHREPAPSQAKPKDMIFTGHGLGLELQKVALSCLLGDRWPSSLPFGGCRVLRSLKYCRPARHILSLLVLPMAVEDSFSFRFSFPYRFVGTEVYIRCQGKTQQAYRRDQVYHCTQWLLT